MWLHEREVYVYKLRLPYQIPKENQMPSKTKRWIKFAYANWRRSLHIIYVTMLSHIAFRLMHFDVKSNAIKRCGPKWFSNVAQKKENLILKWTFRTCVCAVVLWKNERDERRSLSKEKRKIAEFPSGNRSNLHSRQSQNARALRTQKSRATNIENSFYFTQNFSGVSVWNQFSPSWLPLSDFFPLFHYDFVDLSCERVPDSLRCTFSPIISSLPERVKVNR